MLSPIMQEIMQLKKRMNDIEKRQSDFSEMLHKTSESNIDYIAMESGVDLDQDDAE